MRLTSLALILLIACGRSEEGGAPPPAPPPVALPTVAEAEALVAQSPEFSEYEFTNAAYSLALDESAMNAPAKEAAAELRRAGWIEIERGKVSLSPKAKDDKRFLVRPNGFMDIVPLAKKEFGEVTAVRPDPDGAAADFTWRWVPNEVGQSFRSGPVHDRYATPQRATATLLRSGDSWTVLRIRPAP